MPNETQQPPTAEIRELRRRITDLERELAGHRQRAERVAEFFTLSHTEERPFLAALAETLAIVLEAKYVIVGGLDCQRNVIQAPAIYSHGTTVTGSDYVLAGTPCADIIGNLRYTRIPDVRQLFPHDTLLAEWNIDSFVGMPLLDSKGAPLGLLAAMWTAPLVDPHQAESVLSLFAGRAARELERLRSDQALRASEARFRTLCQAAPTGIYECDERGFCTFVSTQWEEMTGRSNQDLQGFGWLELVHPDDVASARETWHQAFLQNRPFLDEFRIVLGTGEVRWVRAAAKQIGGATAKPASFVGCIEDITDRKQAEIAQRAIEERFRAFMDNSPAVAFMKDGAGRRVYANRPYMQRFQVGDAAVLGKTDLEMFGPDVARKLAANDERVLAEGRAVATVETLPTADGVLRHWLVYKFPVEAPAGERYVGGVAIDITERRHAEDELRKARDELERRVADRTSSLTAANDRAQEEILERESAEAALRTEQTLLRRLLFRQEAERKLLAYEIHDGPVQYVTAALMHLESAHDAIIGAPPVVYESFDTALGLLRDTIQEARRMINGLQPMVLDESGLVPAIECLINDHFDSQVVRFEHHLRSERLTPLLEGVLFRICQEAITNAMKHSQSPAVQVRLRQDHAWVRLEVIDQGIGFDPDQRNFSNSFGLRGIRERARLLGGHAMIDSAPGHGTRVAVELPVRDL
jgi:PAS domain S-box-containing protein